MIMETVDCDQKCEIPKGVTLKEVPRPRHDWGDVVACPNEGCERAFLVVKEGPSNGHGN
jgi:hypothetical protein